MRTWEHYALIVAILRAWDIAAKLVAHEKATSVQVDLMEGSTILWSNADSDLWRYSIISRDGDLTAHTTETVADAPADEVARLIIGSNYSSPPVYVGA